MTGRTGSGGTAYSYRDDPSVPALDDARPIIVFDGTCVFCSGWMRFVLRHDRDGEFRFLTAQSPLGTALYRHYGLDDRDFETNLLIESGRAFVKSEATLRVLGRLGFPWAMAGVLRVVPRSLLDAGYAVIARNRYRIAGKRDSCMVPSPEQRSRFLD